MFLEQIGLNLYDSFFHELYSIRVSESRRMSKAIPTILPCWKIGHSRWRQHIIESYRNLVDNIFDLLSIRRITLITCVVWPICHNHCSLLRPNNPARRSSSGPSLFGLFCVVYLCCPAPVSSIAAIPNGSCGVPLCMDWPKMPDCHHF